MIQAVIFDMDGVLVDSEVHWKKVENEFLGGIVPGWSAEDQRGILGMSAYDVHALLVERYGATLSRQEYVEYYIGMAREIYGEHSRLIAGALQSIESFHRARMPLALASSSPHDWIGIVLDRFELRRFFPVVVSSDDVGGKGKPAPDIYLLTAEKLGVAPEHCAAIEDSTKGIASAKAAGMFCAGFRNGFNDNQSLDEADAVLEKLGEFVPEFLGRLT